MSRCIASAESGSGSERCPNAVLQLDRNFCELHSSLYRIRYTQYKKLDLNAQKLYRELDPDKHDIYHYMRVYSRIYSAYKARRDFRRKAVHPSAYDRGHDLRINILWEWMEKCVSVISTMHVHTDDENPAEAGLDGADVDSDSATTETAATAIDRSCVPNERRIRSNIRINQARNRCTRQMQKVRDEERMWSHFIPLALQERQAITDKIEANISEIIEIVSERYKVQMTREELSWIRKFRHYIRDILSSTIHAVMSNHPIFVCVTKKHRIRYSDITNYDDHLTCLECIVKQKEQLKNLPPPVDLNLPQSMYDILGVVPQDVNIEYADVRLARTGCDEARIYLYLPERIYTFAYVAATDDYRRFLSPRGTINWTIMNQWVKGEIYKEDIWRKWCDQKLVGDAECTKCTAYKFLSMLHARNSATQDVVLDCDIEKYIDHYRSHILKQMT